MSDSFDVEQRLEQLTERTAEMVHTSASLQELAQMIEPGLPSAYLKELTAHLADAAIDLVGRNVIELLDRLAWLGSHGREEEAGETFDKFLAGMRAKLYSAVLAGYVAGRLDKEDASVE